MVTFTSFSSIKMRGKKNTKLKSQFYRRFDAGKEIPNRDRSVCLFYILFWLLVLFSSLQPLDSLAGLLDFSLLYHLWISSTFLLLTWYMTVLLFRIYVTEVQSSFWLL